MNYHRIWGCFHLERSNTGFHEWGWIWDRWYNSLVTRTNSCPPVSQLSWGHLSCCCRLTDGQPRWTALRGRPVKGPRGSNNPRGSPIPSGPPMMVSHPPKIIRSARRHGLLCNKIACHWCQLGVMTTNGVKIPVSLVLAVLLPQLLCL